MPGIVYLPKDRETPVFKPSGDRVDDDEERDGRNRSNAWKKKVTFEDEEDSDSEEDEPRPKRPESPKYKPKGSIFDGVDIKVPPRSNTAKKLAESSEPEKKTSEKQAREVKPWNHPEDTEPRFRLKSELF